MFFSEKYPEIMASIEEKLKKQVEDRGLDFENVRKDVADGLNYELEFYGIAGFGSKYALMRTPGPMFFEYRDVFWAYGKVLKTNGGEDVECVVIAFNNGDKLPVKIRDIKDEITILGLIEKANKKALIGDSEAYQTLFEDYKKSIGIVEEEPQVKDKAPEPVEKFPDKRIKSTMKKFGRIIELSKKLAELDKNWYVKTHETLAKEDVMKWCADNYAYMPEEYINILTMTNGFCVDYDSQVGYFTLYSFSTDEDTEGLYGRSKEDMQKRSYKSYENCKPSFGWINHKMLHYNPYTGEMFIVKERYHYERIENFEKDILDEVVGYLEIKEKRFENKEKLLNAAADNPFKEMYDELLRFKSEKEADFREITIYEPLSMQEISEWEKKHSVKLPGDYKEWLLLSNGAAFGNRYIYPLEQVNLDELAIGPDNEKGYVVIADLSGFSDILVFDPETAELYVLDDDGDIREGDFEIDIFEEGFEYLEDM